MNTTCGLRAAETVEFSLGISPDALEGEKEAPPIAPLLLGHLTVLVNG